MSEKSDKLRAMLAKEKERRIKLNNRIEILERRIQEEDSAEVNEMVRTAKVTPEQLAALLRQSATATPNPAALSAVGATFEKEVERHYPYTAAGRAERYLFRVRGLFGFPLIPHYPATEKPGYTLHRLAGLRYPELHRQHG